MRRSLILRFLLALLLAKGLWAGLYAASDTDASFQKAVQLYREGHYQEAQVLFETLHRDKPEDTKMTYYLAITQAQLGRYQQARKLYNEIILLEPQGSAAGLAKEGLKYLPKGDQSLDHPPRFDSPGNVGTVGNAGTTGQPAAANPSIGNYSPQELMALQMLMQQMNGNNGNNAGNNMNMMLPFLYGNGQQSGGNGGLDPNMMNSLMMNQLLQNFNLGGEQNNQ